MNNLQSYIRDVPNFPKPGIVFKDITTLLKDPSAVRDVLEQFKRYYRHAGITKVVGIESRGFIFGSMLAAELHAGFVPIRKKGKLPAETLSGSYSLEYGTDSIEIHKDALTPTDIVLLHDDLLATGGTMRAAVELVNCLGAHIKSICFLIELSFLKGRTKLEPYEVVSLIQYTTE
ncbi:MAG: adenine phosphoribosyltransferase [Bacteroidetes bacterium]|nr:adenine phosphoribosyltransferase [Bacteroidota bacterium]